MIFFTNKIPIGGEGDSTPPSVKNKQKQFGPLKSFFLVMIQGAPRTYLGKVIKSGAFGSGYWLSDLTNSMG